MTPPPEHDPKKWAPVFGQDHAQNKDLERDDDSRKNHPALAVNGLGKRFGGVSAVRDVSFTVEAGTVQAVIGPNGAGKTTVLNLVSGLYRPDGGEITLAGRRIAGLAPEQLARLGLSRTFQNLQVFMNMTALENVMVGAHVRLDTRFLAGMLRLPALRRRERACGEEALAHMRFAGLAIDPTTEAGQLAYGDLKRLEIARALAAEPNVLLLDEPAAGLNPTEKAEMAKLIRRVAERGVTVVIVEHDMKLVMGVSDRIVVLDHGQKIAEGTPEDVRADRAVIEAYLGKAAEPARARLAGSGAR